MKMAASQICRETEYSFWSLVKLHSVKAHVLLPNGDDRIDFVLFIRGKGRDNS